MSKLPFGECPGCRHPIWDNDADTKGHSIQDINIVCVYCGVAARWDLLAGKWVAVDVDALPADARMAIRAAQLQWRLLGTDAIMGPELARRNREKKTS